MAAETGKGVILVTGGAGYVGSQTCKLLAKQGYTPVTFDNLVTGHRDAVQWGPLERGDLVDFESIREVIERRQPLAVMHFAAHCHVTESVRDPGKYYRNNVLGTVNLLEAMKQHGVEQIVLSSSCAIYGIPEKNPITEQHPQRPISPYGWTKFMAERILRDFEEAHGIRSVALRYFNAAGADPDAQTGEHHDPETHLIPRVLDVALGRREELVIFGDDYDTPDGTCIRDYIHVSDLADAHLRALNHLISGAGSIQLNLGTEHGFSVLDVVTTAEEVTGRKIARRIDRHRPGDPSRLVADASRAREILDWHPQYGELEIILRHAWNWQQKLYC